MNKKSVAAVLQRLSSVFGVKRSSHLASALGVSPQAISSWKSRESIPYAECVAVAEAHGLSLDWLLTGEGPRLRSGAGEASSESVHTPREQALLALWRELDEDAQREIQRTAEEKKRLTSLEQRVSELEAVVSSGKRLA